MTTKGGPTGRIDGEARRSARRGVGVADVGARSRNGGADQVAETAATNGAWSATWSPFAVFAEAAAKWMPEQVAKAWTGALPDMSRAPRPASGFGKDAWDYWVDSCQRTVLFWDVMRKRGNQAIEHYQKGKPPVLVFDYELVIDGRTLERPVNYMLLRIKPEPGIATRPEQAAVRDRRPARRARPRHRRLQGSEPGRRRPARRPSRSISSPSIPSPSPARRSRTSPGPRRSSCARCRSCIPRPRASRSWSATARPAGRS